MVLELVVLVGSMVDVSIKGYASSKKLDIVNAAPFSCSQFSNSDLPHIIKKEKRLHNYKY
jgi:hypothetical protein